MDSEEQNILNPPADEKEEPVKEEYIEVARNLQSKMRTIRNIFSYDWLTSDFMKRQRMLLILFFILTMFYISNRYLSQREWLQIIELRQEKQEKQFIWLNTQSDVSASTCPSAIETMVNESGLNLQTTSIAPFEIPAVTKKK